jgi:hypothetical protein
VNTDARARRLAAVSCQLTQYTTPTASLYDLAAGILGTHQAHVDALVEAGVLYGGETRTGGPAYWVTGPKPEPDPPHVHDWTPKRADRSPTYGTGVVQWQCDCHEVRYTEAPKPDAQ